MKMPQINLIYAVLLLFSLSSFAETKSNANLGKFFAKEVNVIKGGLGFQCLFKTDQEYQVYLSQNKSNDPDMYLPQEQVKKNLISLGAENFTQEKPSAAFCYLSEAENMSVYFYTFGGYREINKALRTGDVQTLKKYKLAIKYLISALNKFKNYEGYVKRGADIPFEILQKDHIPGNVVNYSSFLSTSIGQGYIASVRYLIYSKTCKYIAPNAYIPAEEEVLCLPGTKFLVRYAEVHKEVLMIPQLQIIMEEVDQKFDLDQYIDELEKSKKGQ